MTAATKEVNPILMSLTHKLPGWHYITPGVQVLQEFLPMGMKYTVFMAAVADVPAEKNDVWALALNDKGEAI